MGFRILDGRPWGYRIPTYPTYLELETVEWHDPTAQPWHDPTPLAKMIDFKITLCIFTCRNWDPLSI